MREGEVDLTMLEGQIRREGISRMLPPRLAGSVRLQGVPIVRDVLAVEGGAHLAVIETADGFVVSPLVAEGGSVRRAVAGDGAFAGVASFVAAGVPSGRFRPRIGPRRAPRAADAGPERAIDVDQSNDSVVVGESLVVKVYVRTTPGPQPGLDLPEHLAIVGFDRTPTPHGAVLWHDDAAPSVLLATLSAFVPGARDGWDWYVELLLHWLDGDATHEDTLRLADEVGDLVARLHLALASPSAVIPTPVSTADRRTVAEWRRRAESTLDDALAIAGDDVGPRLRELAADVLAAFEGFDDVEETPVMRIHGDLHVGQILRSERGLVVSDFDGNPLAPPQARLALDTPARDVASMVRALDHVGRVVQRRRPDAAPDVDAWIGEARVRFLTTYRAALGAAGLFDERLLFPLEVAQECHEHVYAARYLPRWSYVPDLALPALLEAGP